jgi:hypothetical protein
VAQCPLESYRYCYLGHPLFAHLRCMRGRASAIFSSGADLRKWPGGTPRPPRPPDLPLGPVHCRRSGAALRGHAY